VSEFPWRIHSVPEFLRVEGQRILIRWYVLRMGIYAGAFWTAILVLSVWTSGTVWSPVLVIFLIVWGVLSLPIFLVQTALILDALAYLLLGHPVFFDRLQHVTEGRTEEEQMERVYQIADELAGPRPPNLPVIRPSMHPFLKVLISVLDATSPLSAPSSAAVILLARIGLRHHPAPRMRSMVIPLTRRATEERVVDATFERISRRRMLTPI
jgi:hypothetical protein